MKIWFWNHDCQTAAGDSSAKLWESLKNGRAHVRAVPTQDWPVSPTWSPKACLWDSPRRPSRQKLGDFLERAYKGAAQDFQEKLVTHKKGIILASTKGAIEDFIWNEKPSIDPVHVLLQDFLASHVGEFRESLSISHACTSFLIALKWAQEWIAQGRVDGVWVLSVDEVGPFVLNGFNCLKALSTDQSKPFSADRNGLNLGEAAVAIYVSKFRPPQAAAVYADDVATDTEGYAVTRPSSAGDSLYRVCKQVIRSAPDFIIAHGTGTPINDQIEDQVFRRLFEIPPPITCTKWSVGHTLGSSAGVDLCAALEVFKRQELFKIATTEAADPKFLDSYLTKSSDLKTSHELHTALITSLGFGGVHASTLLKVDYAN